MKTIIYSKYSNERGRAFSIRTDILEEDFLHHTLDQPSTESEYSHVSSPTTVNAVPDSFRCVRKTPVYPEGQSHIQALYRHYQTLSEMTEGTRLSWNRCIQVSDGVELEYIEGESLEEKLLFTLHTQGTEACAREFLDNLRFIRSLHTGAFFAPCEEFRQVFGDVSLPVGTDCAPCTDIDLLCENILVSDDRWIAIDYEWSFDFSIPVNFLLYRMILHFTDNANRGEEFRRYDFMGQMGITDEEIIAFAAMEAHFQQYILQDHVPIRNLYSAISDGYCLPEDHFVQENLQVYFDYGDGFSEENSTLYRMRGEPHLSLKQEIPLPDGIKALRIDPGYHASMVHLSEFRFDSQEKRASFCLREGTIVGDWIYFSEEDPNIFLTEIPQGVQSFLVALESYQPDQVPLEETCRLAKEYQELKTSRLMCWKDTVVSVLKPS
ncbi:MAG: hypothetical protein LIP11_07345 [Clostridiales bacterium]|nr:hypothetical protein [Clostridiales bacterium]